MIAFRSLLLLFALFLLIGSPLSGQSAAPLDQLQVITPENAADLQEIARYGSGNITATAWAADVIAVGGSLGVWLYDANDLDADPRLIPTQRPMQSARQVKLSTDGRRVAALDDTAVRVWDTTTGDEIAAFTAEQAFNNLALSGDGTLLFTAHFGWRSNYHAVLSVWEIATGREIAHNEEWGYPYIVNGSFTPDNRYIAFTGTARVQLFAVETATFITCCGAESDWSYTLSIDAAGELIAFAQADGITVWNLAAREQIAYVPYPMGVAQVYLSPHNLQLAIIDTYDSGAWAWRYDLETPPVHLAALDRTYSFAFAPDNQQIVGIWLESQLVIADAQAGTEITRLGDHSIAWDIALLPDDRTLAVSEGSGDLQFVNLATGEQHAISTGYDLVVGVAAHPDGERLLYAGVDFADSGWNWGPGAITLLHLASGAAQTTPQAGTFWYPTFTPDGSAFVAVDGVTRQILLWDTQQFGEIDARVIAPADPGSLIFSPDGRLLFARGIDRQGQILDMTTGNRLPLEPTWETMKAVAFSPDGKTLALVYETQASADDFITLLNLLTYEFENVSWASGYARGSEISGLTYTPAGDLLICLFDGDVRVFNPLTHALVTRQPLYPDFTALAGDLILSSDGRFIVTATRDGLIRVWGVPES